MLDRLGSRALCSFRPSPRYLWIDTPAGSEAGRWELDSREPRVYFKQFNDASLNLLVVYWCEPPDYWMFVDFNHRVNMEILRRLNEEGIDFSFPTQTVHLSNDANRQLALRILEHGVNLS